MQGTSATQNNLQCQKEMKSVFKTICIICHFWKRSSFACSANMKINTTLRCRRWMVTQLSVPAH